MYGGSKAQNTRSFLLLRYSQRSILGTELFLAKLCLFAAVAWIRSAPWRCNVKAFASSSSPTYWKHYNASKWLIRENHKSVGCFISSSLLLSLLPPLPLLPFPFYPFLLSFSFILPFFPPSHLPLFLLSLYIFSWDNMVSIVLTFFILMQCYCTTTKVPLPFCPLLKFIKNHYNRFAIVLTIIPVCSYLISPASNCLRPSTNALVLLPAKASYLPPITWYPWSMSVFQRLFINTISLIMTK